MGFGSRAFLAGGLGFAAAFATACGGATGLLSSDQANTLSTQLAAVSSAVDAHNCRAATSAAASFTSAVGHLPASVSNKLVQSLGDGAVTVQQLAARDCSSSSSSSSSTTDTTSTPSTSTTVTTVTQTTSNHSTTQSQSSTATNPPGPGTSTTTNGGASLGTGTGANGNGNGNNNGGNGNGNGNGGTGQ
jgi:hypothetical protein